MQQRSRRILGLAIPATITLAADPIMGLVDTAVLGRVGAAELGALGLAVSVLAAVSWIFNFLVHGTTSTVARAAGASQPALAGRRISHAAQVAVALGVVVGGTLLIGAPVLVRALGAVEALQDPTVTYLRIRALGVPLLLLAYVGHGAFRGVGDTRTPLAIVVVANLVNAVLTVWLVFGVGLGIAGAAWATVVAELLVVVAFVALLRRTGLALVGHGRPDRRQLLALVRVSRDLFVRTGSLLLALLVVTSAAARIDPATAAGHQVLYQTFLLVSFLMDGIAIAAQTMVGNALGAGRPAEARAIGRTLVRWGLVGGVGFAALLLAGSALVPRMLTDDPAVLAVVAGAWWLAALGQAINGPVFALDGVLMGAEDFAYLRRWMVVAAAIAIAGAVLVVGVGGGLLGLWVAVQSMMLVRLLSVMARVRSSAWLRAGSGSVSDGRADPHREPS